MNLHQLMRDLREDNGSKIVLIVADGLGGLPLELGGKTELETARTPNMDAMVREGICGLSTPVLPGISPGSGPGPGATPTARRARWPRVGRGDVVEPGRPRCGGGRAQLF